MEMEALDDLERLRAVKSSAALLCSACSPRPSRVQPNPPAANKVNRTTRHGRVSVTVRAGVATRAAVGSTTSGPGRRIRGGPRASRGGTWREVGDCVGQSLEPERVVILIISLDIWLQVNISGDATQLLTDDNVFKENFRDRALFLSLWFEGFDTGAAFGTRRQYVESFQKRRP